MGFLDSSLGALELGILCSSLLYGISLLQVFMYAERDFADPLWLRVIVGIIWIIDTAHTLSTWIFLYSLTVTNFGVLAKIDRIHWTIALGFPLAAITGSIVQTHTANKVRVLSQRLVPAALAFTCALLRCGFGFAIFIVAMASRLHTVSDFTKHYEWLLVTPLGINVFFDVLNTSILCLLLQQHKSESRISRKVVTKLMMYTIETGVMTSLCAVAILCVAISQYPLVALGLLSIYPKLYSNSFLASLNARLSLRQMYQQRHTTSITFTHTMSPLSRSRESEHRDSV